MPELATQTLILFLVRIMGARWQEGKAGWKRHFLRLLLQNKQKNNNIYELSVGQAKYSFDTFSLICVFS